MAYIDELLKKSQDDLTADEIQEIIDYRVSVELKSKELELEREIALAESEVRLSMQKTALEKSQSVLNEILELSRERLRRAANEA